MNAEYDGIAGLVAHVGRLTALTTSLAPFRSTAGVADDISLIQTQGERAAVAIRGIESRGASDPTVDEELHRFNNLLTGIISLSALCAEDAALDPSLSELVTKLHAIESTGRACAHAVRAHARRL